MFRRIPRRSRIATGSVLALVALTVAGCASLPNPFAEPDPRWADYKGWTRVTEEPSTGASPGLGAVHQGPEGYRVVYVNDVGADTILSEGDGSGDYDYPEGTVVVKEQYPDEAAYLAGAEAGEVDVTVSLKVADGADPAANWHWSTGYTDTAGDSAFCSGCHQIPIAKDFVFSNANYLAAE